jgi:hypothetical protein
MVAYLPISPIVTAGACTLPVAFGILGAFITGRSIAIPPMLIDELSHEGKYSCQPCTSSNLRTACEIVRPIFGPDYVDWEVLEQWRMKNPQGFMEVTNERNELVACFIFEGLQSAFFDQLIRGAVVEAQITGETVLAMRDAKKQQKIYVGGVMVKDPHKYSGARRAQIMLWCMIKYLHHHFDINKTLYALGLNRDSEKLLEALEFSIVTSAANRIDRHNFYELKLSDSIREKILQRVGDLSPCCKISYSSRA